ncbi:MAG: pyridoxamine kinase [Bacteroidota bacterium]|nr:pyridoxamine kinase [Bacteroidota bacterium]
MKRPVPRIAAIHDLSGIGRVSLSSIFPIFSTMGIQVCALPTAVLSSHTQYPNVKFLSLDDQMLEFIAHWKSLNMDFDAIYSGYLGSVHQIDIVRDFIDDFKRDDQLVVVDPVMADNGELYATFTDEMVVEMRRLIEKADMITPNLTEAAFLLGAEYSETISIEKVKQWCLKLAEKGPEIIIITSVPEDNGKKAASIAYHARTERFWKVSVDYLPASYPGTGDAFTSVLTAAIIQGDSLPIALDRAVNFISLGVRATFGHDYDPREGIMLERVLHTLDGPVQSSSYQIID